MPMQISKICSIFRCKILVSPFAPCLCLAVKFSRISDGVALLQIGNYIRILLIFLFNALCRAYFST